MKCSGKLLFCAMLFIIFHDLLSFYC
jgi:hypothetical protein